MHTHRPRPHRKPHTAHRLIALLALFALFPCAGDAADDAASALERATTLDAELARAPAAGPGDGTDALEDFSRRERRLDELGLALDEAIAAAGPDAAERDRLARLVTKLFERLRDTARDLQDQIDLIRGERAKAEPEALIGYEYRLRDYDALYSELLDDYHDNAERAARLDLTAEREVARFEQMLTERATKLSERIEVAFKRRETARERVAEASGEKEAELEAELAALEERMERLKVGLQSTMALMRERGLDVSDQAQVLIRTTGEISGDILDTRVLLGLADNWLGVMMRTIADDGPGWLFKLLLFLAILGVFKMFANVVERMVRRAVSTSKMHFSTLLQDFFVTVAANAVLILGLLIALSQLGVELGPVLAGLGVAGFIIGFALQETLSNFASGMMILIYRPFDVGDVVEAGGVSGKVSQMSLVSTTILTFDNQKLVVPNNKIWGDVIRNVNAEPQRRVDLTFGIGYEDDIAKAEGILTDIISAHELVLDEPAPTIRLHTLGESSVDFIVRPWVNAADYWAVYWDVTRAVKERFDAEGISIPFPQRDVHIYQEDPPAEEGGKA